MPSSATPGQVSPDPLGECRQKPVAKAPPAKGENQSEAENDIEPCEHGHEVKIRAYNEHSHHYKCYDSARQDYGNSVYQKGWKQHYQ